MLLEASRGRWALGSSVAALALGLGFWWFQAPGETVVSGAAPVETSVPSAWKDSALGGNLPRNPLSNSNDVPDPQQAVQALFADGSLQGASLDGDWGVWNGRQLQPSIRLRQRFDQLLSTRGETRMDDLRALVLALADRDLDASGAAAVISVWDRYVALGGQATPEMGKGPILDAIREAYAELRQRRRAQLGAAWADAFFTEDEALFDQAVNGMASGNPPAAMSDAEQLVKPNLGADPNDLHRQRVAVFGMEAADRMKEEEALQRRWALSVEDARAAFARINAAAELTLPLRRVEMQRYLDTHFDAQEQLRIKGLLGIDPGVL